MHFHVELHFLGRVANLDLVVRHSFFPLPSLPTYLIPTTLLPFCGLGTKRETLRAVLLQAQQADQ